MARALPQLLVCALLAALAGCGDGDDADTAVADASLLRGAPIDGSADAGASAEQATATDADARSTDAAPAEPDPRDDAAPAEPADDTTGAADAPKEGPTNGEPAAPEGVAAADASADAGATDAAASKEDDEATEEATTDEADDDAAASEAPALPKPDEDGVYHIEFAHLSLEGEDVDNIIDYLLFPEEFEDGEGFRFPEHIAALDGKEVTLEGYMIPGRIRSNKVRDFMLVRDLAGCCFGGAPNPDEWVDVVMVEGEEAEYLRYLPVTVRGTFELIGEQDQEGYAVGVYRMEASWAGEVD